jgi:hypothetical protein
MSERVQVFIYLFAFIGACVAAMALWFALAEVVGYIRRLVDKPEWVPCLRSKPTVGQLVLVWRDHVPGSSSYFVSRMMTRHESDGTPYWDGIGYDTVGHVTHWMQLPEPPDGKT